MHSINFRMQCFKNQYIVATLTPARIHSHERSRRMSVPNDIVQRRKHEVISKLQIVLKGVRIITCVSRTRMTSVGRHNEQVGRTTC